MMSRYPGPWFAPLHLRDKGWWGPLHQVGLKDTEDNAPWLPFLPVPTNTSQHKGDNFNSDYLFNFHAKSFRYNRDLLELDFVIKTYHMVDDPNTDKWISWLDHGQSFVVRCQMEFSRDVLPRYMNMEGFSRFVFTLSAYGFVFRVRDYEHIEFGMAGFENREGHYWKKGFEHNLDPWTTGLTPSREILREDPIQKLLPDTCFQEYMLKEGLLKVSAFRRRPRVPLFLVKTYVMVDDPANDNIVSWGPTGKSFVVWNAQKLYTDLLPAYFKHGDFAKFVLELCAFGFRFRSLKDTVQFEFALPGFSRGKKQPLQKVPENDFSGGQRQDLSSAVSKKEKGVVNPLPGIGRRRKDMMEISREGPLKTKINSASSRSYKGRWKLFKLPLKRRVRLMQAARQTPSELEDELMKGMMGVKGVVMRIKEKYMQRLLEAPSSWEFKKEKDVVELKERMREVVKVTEEAAKGLEEITSMLLD